MKCPFCNQEHADNPKFCPNTGEKLEIMKACLNEECPQYNKYILPADAVFCPVCGTAIPSHEDKSKPFHLRHPEYNLIPYCEYATKYDNNQVGITWFRKNLPEFIEDKPITSGMNFFWIAKQNKLGVLKCVHTPHWYGDDYVQSKIIPCQYDKIEDKGDYYVCHDGNNCTMFNRDGDVIG